MARSQRQGKRSQAARKQARAVRTRPAAEAVEPVDAAVSVPSATPGAARPARPYQAGKKPQAPRPVVLANVLPREQEYAFIREDLQRLLLTSGILTVVMIALLFVIDR